MSVQIVPSRRFLKAVKRYRRSGDRRILESAEEVVHLLSIGDKRSFSILGTRWRDHALKGNKQGIRELHLSVDDLLLYSIDEESSTVELLDIVNHEELRKHF